MALYEIRNNRGVGHVGSDVDPNHVDTTAVLAMSKWVVSELVRLFRNTDTATAATVAESLLEREVPIVWRVGRRTMVLDADLPMRDKMLVTLYSSVEPLAESELVDWVEYSNPSVFRRDVLVPAHKRTLIEYDSDKRTVHISPLGVADLESRLSLTFDT